MTKQGTDKQKISVTANISYDDEHFYKIVRKNIRYYRKKKNLTQQQLSELTDMSREYICDIENDSRNKHVTIAVLGRISLALQIPLSKFFEEKN